MRSEATFPSLSPTSQPHVSEHQPYLITFSYHQEQHTLFPLLRIPLLFLSSWRTTIQPFRYSSSPRYNLPWLPPGRTIHLTLPGPIAHDIYKTAIAFIKHVPDYFVIYLSPHQTELRRAGILPCWAQCLVHNRCSVSIWWKSELKNDRAQEKKINESLKNQISKLGLISSNQKSTRKPEAWEVAKAKFVLPPGNHRLSGLTKKTREILRPQD